MRPDELVRRRVQLKLSQVGLATKLGVAPATIERWEGGINRIPRYLDLALQTLEREHRA